MSSAANVLGISYEVCRPLQLKVNQSLHAIHYYEAIQSQLYGDHSYVGCLLIVMVFDVKICQTV